ncbi:unnamed protein product [Caenorhabditis sp. 36 PRJEB53466]|nr:unnamed protein product [Caenorhabditis sp. 36 PRJEB53466]
MLCLNIASIFVFLAVPVQTDFFLRDKREAEKDHILKVINEERRKSAKAHNFANMWKVEWSEDLMRLAEEMECQEAIGRNYRWFLYGSDFNEYLGIPNDHGLKSTLKGVNKRVIGTGESLMPPQSSIGCVHRGKCGKEEVLCLIGPYSTFTASQIKDGPAGSECGRSGQNEDGLCSTAPDIPIYIYLLTVFYSTMKILLGILSIFLLYGASTVTGTGIREKRFSKDKDLDHLNGLRKEVAKKHNVANMYKLKWNDSLAEEAKDLQCGKAGERLSWFNAPNRAELDRLVKALADNIKLRKTVSNGFFTTFSSNQLSAFYALVPGQTEIGCGTTSCRGKDMEMCYVSPVYGYLPDIFKEGAPGSACGSDKAEDGVCIASAASALSAFCVKEQDLKLAKLTGAKEAVNEGHPAGIIVWLHCLIVEKNDHDDGMIMAVEKNDHDDGMIMAVEKNDHDDGMIMTTE